MQFLILGAFLRGTLPHVVERLDEGAFVDRHGTEPLLDLFTQLLGAILRVYIRDQDSLGDLYTAQNGVVQ